MRSSVEFYMISISKKESMNQYSKCLLVLLTVCWATLSFAQGPPITGDKPIMLGEKTVILKTLTEIRKTGLGTFIKAPIIAHYLPSNKTLVGIHFPLVFLSDVDDFLTSDKVIIGDIELLAKYQFYKKDGTGKTFRMVAKTLQTLPTGKEFFMDGISTGEYQSYFGMIAGYESLKLGISNELGYNIRPESNFDELRYKLGFGWPLLKPTYPVKQINIYFETQSSWFVEQDDFVLSYAQGIQYAKGRITIEGSFQFPIVDTLDALNHRDFSVYLGTRYVF